MLFGSASALSTTDWPNLWTFIYYTALLMAAIISIVSQFGIIFHSQWE